MPELRASDADRERAVASLRHHVSAGRLTVDERVTIDLEEFDDGTTQLVASGVAPLPIRRAFADLQD